MTNQQGKKIIWYCVVVASTDLSPAVKAKFWIALRRFIIFAKYFIMCVGVIWIDVFNLYFEWWLKYCACAESTVRKWFICFAQHLGRPCLLQIGIWPDLQNGSVAFSGCDSELSHGLSSESFSCFHYVDFDLHSSGLSHCYCAACTWCWSLDTNQSSLLLLLN